jgi:hypothetical protein
MMMKFENEWFNVKVGDASSRKAEGKGLLSSMIEQI